MGTSLETVEFLRDALALVPELSFRAMMGEYCVYSAGRVFGLVCDDTLFLKTTPATMPLFHDQKTRAYPGSRNTSQVNAEWLEDKEKMAEMVRITLESVQAPKAPRKKGRPVK
jgi:TfoX/Sxy family transcriptional regulator of competence genes